MSDSTPVKINRNLGTLADLKRLIEKATIFRLWLFWLVILLIDYQCKKWRIPVKTMAMPASLAA